MYFKEAEKIDLKTLSESELIQLEKDILKEPNNFTPKGSQRTGTKRIINKINGAKFFTAYTESIQLLNNENRIQNSNEEVAVDDTHDDIIKKMGKIIGNRKNYDISTGRLTKDAQQQFDALEKKSREIHPRIPKPRKEIPYKLIDVDALVTVDDCESALITIKGEDSSYRRKKNMALLKYEWVLVKAAKEKVDQIEEKIERLEVIENGIQEIQEEAEKMELIGKIDKEIEAMDATVAQMKEFDEKRIQESKRGGKREGSGRKKKEKTVMVRCPESIKAEILAIIKKYKETGDIEG